MSERVSAASLSINHNQMSFATWGRASVILLFIGAIIGPLLDGTHSHTDTLRYTTPVFWLMAWWTPLVFAFGSLATGLSYPLMEKILKRPTPRLPLSRVLLANALFYLSYILSAYLPLDVVGKTTTLTILWIISWLACDRTLIGIALSLTAAICGPLFESFLSQNELFHYTNPDFLGVPAWLPALYAVAAIGNGYLGKMLVEGKISDPNF